MAKVRSAASAFAVSLVILGLAFVGATALAILFYAQNETAKHDAEAAKAEIAKLKGLGDESKPAVLAVLAETDKPGTLVSRLADKNDDLMLRIQKLEKDDLRLAKQKLDEATADLNQKQAELALLKNQNASISATSAAQVKIAQTEADNKTQEAAKRTAEANLKITGVDEEIKTVTENLNAAIAAHQAALAEKDQLTAEKEKLVAQLKEELKQANERIRRAHQPLFTDVAMPNGTVSEALDNGDAYIKLGSAERVRLGMTFEVFPANSVIHLQAGNTVIGKATLEVYRVEPHDCIARVVRRSLNARVLAGDSVVNLAYNPHGEVNFVVFGGGGFDINNTKNPNVMTEDENRIKALITSTGGNVVEIDPNNPQVSLSPDVDYLVLGKDPRPPLELTSEEAGDEIKVQAFKKAQKNYNLYVSLMGQARQMQIPVLNQNRFLELVGFYHRAKVKAPAVTASSN